MTSVAFDAMDLVAVVANIRDRESIQLVARIVHSQTAVMEAQLAQLKQLQGVLQERIAQQQNLSAAK